MPKSQKKEEEEEEVFHVEVITKARVVEASSEEEDDDDRTNKKRKRKGKGKPRAEPKPLRWEYYVKCSHRIPYSSWEPETNVAGCQRLLSSFWAHVGTDNADYPVGYMVEASEKWINSEKKYFRREFNQAQEKLRIQREKDRAERRLKVKKKKPTSENRRPKLFTASKSKSRTTSLAASEDDESDDDRPLLHKRKRKTPEESSDDIPDWATSLFSAPGSPTSPAQPVPPTTVPNRSLPLPPTNTAQPSSSKSTPTEPPLTIPSRSLPLPPVKRAQTSSAKSTPTIPAKMPSIRPLTPTVVDNLASGSALSTKQRLAQGALAPTRPKAIPLPPPKPKSQAPPAIKTSTATASIMPLGFKKKAVPTPTLSTSGSFAENRSPLNEPTLAGLNAPPSSPTQHQSQDDHTNVPRELHPNLTLSQSHRPPAHHPPPSANTGIIQAENYLRSILPQIAAPLTPAVEQPFEHVPPKALVKRLPPPPPVKRWSWSGPVFTEAKTSELFNVTFFETTKIIEGGMRFSVALATTEKLEFLSFHDIADLDSILLACDGIHQLARVGPEGNDDVLPLQIFCTYMVKMQKMVLWPISLDDNVVGHIIFFTDNFTRPGFITRRFRPPNELQRMGSLIAALVPWSLSSGQLQKNPRKPPNTFLPGKISIEPMIADKARWERTVRSKPSYQHALRVLNFPQQLYDFMSGDRTYWTWHEGADGTKKKPGMETRMLVAIMDQCRATKPRKNLADTRVVFVHVGAVHTLHKLSGFQDFCSSLFHIQFYTYGSHENVPPLYWGIREIYPCGGIATFTPKVILEDLLAVINRIEQIGKHPLWECYVMPVALGLVAKLVGQRQNEDPLVLYDRGIFPYVKILDAIENGELALLNSPPCYELSPTENNNPRQDWLAKHWSRRPQGPRCILKSAIEAFNVAYGNTQQSEWASAVHSEISKDLMRMRCQPILMEYYRRYVVIESPNERRISMTDGVSLYTPCSILWC
ncbi:hypothetical protein H0H81_003506 [Sphagnurus paluster]|uniref:Chromo domain-containing protein n=1 Tax=Sphagnurus paluster TaxID=117069 RepID=A0A9P7FVF0_9AGAR|nr:hypothetical protein H0H81_003506 [Sphagnurus paluster]